MPRLHLLICPLNGDSALTATIYSNSLRNSIFQQIVGNNVDLPHTRQQLYLATIITHYGQFPLWQVEQANNLLHEAYGSGSVYPTHVTSFVCH